MTDELREALEAQISDALLDCGECGHQVSAHRVDWGCWQRIFGVDICPCSLTPDGARRSAAMRKDKGDG